jgi:hypothetical protein
MKSLLKDLYIVLPVMAIISLFSILLYRDFTAKVDVGDARQIGVIVSKRKISHRKYANQVVWEEVEKKMDVYNNDILRTSELSEAKVKLNDGTEIVLNENSMIMLSVEDENVNLNVSHGSLATNRNSTEKKLKIKSGNSEIISGAGSLSLTKSSKGLGVSVKIGKATVDTGQTKTDLGKDEQAIIVGGKSKKTELLIGQSRPTNNAYFLSAGEKKKIKFGWEGITDKHVSYIEI